MGQVASSSAIPSATSKKCHLLTLPPELRNYIYELALSPEPSATVDLLQPTPPSDALVRTCRQIRAESQLMYRRLYREFWRETTFELVFEEEQLGNGWYENLRTKVLQLKTRDLENITKIKVGREGDWCILEDGVWVAYEDLGDESMMITSMMAPQKFVEDLTKLGYECDTEVVNGMVGFSPAGPLDDVEEPKEAKMLLKGRRTTVGDLLSAIKFSGNYGP